MKPPTTLTEVGPFFTGNPERTFEENAREAFGSMAEAGEREAKSLAEPYTFRGAFYRGIVGRTRRLDGGEFRYPGFVVSQTNVYPWPGGGAKQYRGGRLEASRHVFRTSFYRVRSKALDEQKLLRGIE